MGERFPVQYTELHNGKFGKTYMKDGEVTSDMITYEEYASALAHLMLKQQRPKFPTRIE